MTGLGRMTGHPAMAEPGRHRSDAKIARGWLKALSVPLLLLWTPFVIFLTDNEYSLFAPEVLVSLGGLTVLAGLVAFLRMTKQQLWYAMAIAGLLTVFIDYQFEWMVEANKYVVFGLVAVTTVLVVKWQEPVTLIMTAVFATMLGTTVVQSLVRSPATLHLVPDAASAASNAPPRLIHLVLDEHIGIAGLPTHFELARTVKDRLLRFYQRHGFFVYGGAYSHYFRTFDSIPNLLNFSTEPQEKALVVDKKKPPFPLIENRYFDILSQRQYRLNVLGASLIDFCSDETIALQTCRQYKYTALGPLGNQHDSLSHKIPAIFATYLTKYHRYQRLLSAYRNLIQPSLASKGILLPTLPSDSPWTTHLLRPISANAMALIEDLWDNILKLPRGHVLFAHLMLPHYPYIYREDCTARPIKDWRWYGMPEEESRTSDLREEVYGLYLQQVQCLHTKLDILFNRMRAAGMLEDSIIILHGDHGSRLGLHDPYIDIFNVLTESDFSDGFSTLFAVRLPGKQAGYDPSPRALEELLAEVLAIPLKTAPAGSSKPSEPFVYFSVRNQDSYVRYPLPGFKVARGNRQSPKKGNPIELSMSTR